MPQQNGIAKRKNRIIMDMVRCILKPKKKLKELWVEVVASTVPTKCVCYKTPKEAWSGMRPLIRHLKIFGCKAYAHFLDQLKKKLDDKREKVVIINRDVKFDEIAMWGNDNDPSNEEIVNFPLFVDCELVTFGESLCDENWRKAMDDEIHILRRMKYKRPIGVKWMYRIKYNPNGEVDHSKTRLVAKGYKKN
ncbi:hypothetical protein CR513_31056, partial [Mucuna pruriens]